VLLLVANQVNAAPVSLTITTASQITYDAEIEVNSTLFTSFDSSGLAGTLAIDLSHASPGVPNGLDFTASSISPVDLDVLFNLGFLGTTGFTMSDIQLQADTPSPGQLVTGGNFDLLDHEVGLVDATFLPASGLLGGIMAVIYDFPEDALTLSFLPTAALSGTGSVSETPTGNPGEYLVTVTIPLSASDFESLDDDLSFSYVIGGQIVATGLYVVPEPSALVLAAMAGVGTCLLRISHRRRRVTAPGWAPHAANGEQVAAP